VAEPLPFDAAEIAQRIHAGDIVNLGENITLHRSGGSLVQQCRRCVVEARIPYSGTRIAMDLEKLALFIFKHQHKDPPS
jgi:hypothetical protein